MPATYSLCLQQSMIQRLEWLTQTVSRAAAFNIC